MVFERALAEAAEGTGITLLVLFGSRVRGEVHAHSDWDFGYIGDGQSDMELVQDSFMRILGTERIDLVDLSRASALLRFQVGSEGRVILESVPGLFQQFQIETAVFWCDIEPVLRRAYGKILEKVKAA